MKKVVVLLVVLVSLTSCATMSCPEVCVQKKKFLTRAEQKQMKLNQQLANK